MFPSCSILCNYTFLTEQYPIFKKEFSSNHENLETSAAPASDLPPNYVPLVKLEV
jgi:hypothetical protein